MGKFHVLHMRLELSQHDHGIVLSKPYHVYTLDRFKSNAFDVKQSLVYVYLGWFYWRTETYKSYACA